MNQSIAPFTDNPRYWQVFGKPTLLLGGSVEDNLFQIDGLENHLKQLAACGGNYIRCTMSSRDEGDVWPFEREGESGLYDLTKPGHEYWSRFERLLELCESLQIVLQIELWDRFDFARDPWQLNPFNPKNNVNYTSEQAGLMTEIDRHPAKRDNAFFRAVPELENNQVLLPYQHSFADELLKRTLARPNVLYCMDNETNEDPAWPAYWSSYIKARASEAGVTAMTTEMWDAHDITSDMHRATWENPQQYDFCDVSQNNHQQGYTHYVNLTEFRATIEATGKLRPLNSVKVYGANTGFYGSNRDAQERFWRCLFGGLASVRFHRPPTGLGLSDLAQKHLRAARSFADRFDFFSSAPTPQLLTYHTHPALSFR